MKCDWLVSNKLSFITVNDVKHILTTNFLSQISVALYQQVSQEIFDSESEDLGSDFH